MARMMRPRHVEVGPLAVEQHTDWRCSTIAWRRGQWRPVVSVRIGRACRPAFGVFFGRDEDGDWELTIAGVVFDALAHLSGPWGG